ncbi:MAG: hypothetical protein JO326_05380 [Acetobacteraceae bacterium]|nr:hypothetical protein [Acetobacteraceae bacterium]
MDARLVNVDALRATRAQNGSPGAVDLVLRARAVLNEPPSQDRAYISLGLFLQALRADPNAVPAMAGAAAVFAGAFSGNSAIKRAADLLSAAEARAPDSPDVIAAKFLLLQREQRTHEALAMYARLLEVNPSATALIVQIGLSRSWTMSEEALPLLQRTIRLNPLSPQIANVKVEYARDLLLIGRNVEAIQLLEPLLSWDLVTAEAGERATQPPGWQNNVRLLLAIAYVRVGRADDARQIAAKAMRVDGLSDFSVRAWLRNVSEYNDPERVARLKQMAADLREAGVPDHLDESTDSGVPSTSEFQEWEKMNTPTPMTVPGGRTIVTGELADLLARGKPVILTTTSDTPSVPGAIYLDMPMSGSRDDDWQPKLARLLQELTGSDKGRSVVVFSFNRNRWQSRNLALRLIALGYTDVLWYRGGWEAWEASGQPREPLARRTL